MAQRASREESGLHQPEAFPHEALETRTPDQVVGQLFIREHRQRGLSAVGDHLRGIIYKDLKDRREDNHRETVNREEGVRLVTGRVALIMIRAVY